MIVAWLCGAFFGGLVVWERWAHAERERRWQQLLDTLPPSDDEFDMDAWDKLSNEALANFERQLGAAPYESGTDSVLGMPTTLGTLGTLPQGTVVDSTRRIGPYGTYCTVAKDWKPVEGLRHISTGDLPI